MYQNNKYCVYYYYDQTTKETIYVGMTNDFDHRNREHYHDRNINRLKINRFLQTTTHNVDIFMYGSFPDRGKACEIEQFLIKKYKPEYNVKGKE